MAAIAAGEAEQGQLLGHGHLAMTIDQGLDMSRYQGLVPLEGHDLEHAAHEYFLRSEQIPTRVRLAVAEEFRGGEKGARRRWRAIPATLRPVRSLTLGRRMMPGSKGVRSSIPSTTLS